MSSQPFVSLTSVREDDQFYLMTDCPIHSVHTAVDITLEVARR